MGHRDDDAMIIDDDKKYSCKMAAKYLQSPEGKRTCEADPSTVKSWWLLCCPEAEVKKERTGEERFWHERESKIQKEKADCSLCPSRIDLEMWIRDGAKEYSCKDAATYLKTPTGKKTCKSKPELMALWNRTCCSSAKERPSPKKGKGGKNKQKATKGLEKKIDKLNNNGKNSVKKNGKKRTGKKNRKGKKGKSQVITPRPSPVSTLQPTRAPPVPTLQPTRAPTHRPAPVPTLQPTS